MHALPHRLASLLLTLSCALALFVPSASAATVRGLSLDGLVHESDLIGVGTVVASHSVWHRFPGLPEALYTLTEIRLSRTLLGAERPGEVILLMQPGGALDGLSRTVPGTARLEPGDRVLTFTRTDGATHYLVGMAQGIFFLTDAPTPRWTRPSTPHLATGGPPHAPVSPDRWLEGALIAAIEELSAARAASEASP